MRELFAIRPDGGGLRQLTDNLYFDSQAHWSPNGRHIVFISERDSVSGDPPLRAQVYLMDADGSNVRQLTSDNGSPNNPRWSFDGTRITFHRRSAAGFQQVHVMNADGSQVRALTDGLADDHSAEWSPDGTTILFLSHRPPRNVPTMYLMNPDGTGQRMLSGSYACEDNVHEARWSPDGTRIAYTCESTLYVIRADGTSRMALGGYTPTNDSVYANPAWSPDGRQIAFTGGTSAGWDVYVMSATGGSRSRLTHDPATDFVFDWRRAR